jgi:hypothetical protein
MLDSKKAQIFKLHYEEGKPHADGIEAVTGFLVASHGWCFKVAFICFPTSRRFGATAFLGATGLRGVRS